MDDESIAGKFLIAAPDLDDPNFTHSVVLVCEHTGEGAFGLVVNRILMKSFKPLLPALELETSVIDGPIYYGGPVKPDQGYVIYSPYRKEYGAIRISDDLGVTASKKILSDIAEGRGPEKFMLVLGFSGWAANQLEEELMIDSWLVAPATSRLIFEQPVSDRWRAAAGSIGIDFERFICKSGSA